MQMPEILVVRTGTANLASVLAGFERVDAKPRVSMDPDEIETAKYVVLPGVGAFAAALDQLEKANLIDPLKNRFSSGKATLAVCLGLQILCESSEESPGVKGLGVINEKIRRFPDTVRVPQLGWNQVEPQPGCELLETGYAYFANSFRLTTPPEGWAVALSDHAGPFVAAMEKGRILACQFHPELSGKWGLALLSAWLEKGGRQC